MLELTDHDRIVQMHTVLLGTNGQKGLCKKHEELAQDYYKFKRAVITVFAFLVGSGVLGLSAVKIAEAVAKGGG